MNSLSGRLNGVLFNTMVTLVALGAVNYLSVRFDNPEPSNLNFEFLDYETFVADRYIKEDASAFYFNF
jgi:hypothetical protein